VRGFGGAHLGTVWNSVEPWRSLSNNYVLTFVEQVDQREGPGARWLYRRRFQLAAQGQIMLMQPGELMCIPERTPAANLRLVVFHADALGAAYAERSGLDRSVLPDLPTSQTGSQLLSDAIRTLHGFGADLLADPLACETAVLALVSTLARERLLEHAGPPRDRRATCGLDGRIAAVRDAIHDCPARSWTLAELASIARIDRFALVREFKRRHGAPPHAYQVQVRLACSRKLLESGHRVCDVARAVGFADQAHFTRLFSRHLRTTPAAYARAVSVHHSS
jgi:AraC-like DNA-binding protein